jgi:hypothetical protein
MKERMAILFNKASEPEVSEFHTTFEILTYHGLKILEAFAL